MKKLLIYIEKDTYVHHRDKGYIVHLEKGTISHGKR